MLEMHDPRRLLMCPSAQSDRVQKRTRAKEEGVAAMQRVQPIGQSSWRSAQVSRKQHNSSTSKLLLVTACGPLEAP